MFKHQTKMAVGLDTTTAKNIKQHDSSPPQTSKLATMLGLLVGGRSLNRFEVVQHNDHCLNSTISALQNGHSIVMDHERETVTCLNGKASVSVSIFWLNTKPDNIKRARDPLAKLERTT